MALHHCQINDCGPVEIPYRAILPQQVENLLAPGRHLSTDDVAIDWLNLIPQCVGTGQGAGVAAAVAVMDGTTTHNVNIRKVQDILVDQNVPLPRNSKFEAKDPSYQELVEENSMVCIQPRLRPQRKKALIPEVFARITIIPRTKMMGN